MSYSINAGISVSLDNTTWYALTDHNRKEIDITPTIIEQSQRMANGKMRKYVIASKKTINTSWIDVPSKSSNTVDLNQSSAWLSEFYNANVFVPVYVKFTHSKVDSISPGQVPNNSTFITARTGSETILCYITKFTLKTKHRNIHFDYVDMDIEFTEI
jgi:hypothetical protein